MFTEALFDELMKIAALSPAGQRIYMRTKALSRSEGRKAGRTTQYASAAGKMAKRSLKDMQRSSQPPMNRTDSLINNRANLGN